MTVLPGCEGRLDDPAAADNRGPTVTAVKNVATPHRFPSVPISDVREVRSGDTAHLVEVRLAGNDGFDRLVLEFADRVPGYTVGYRPLPARADGSGDEIPLPGASATVKVALNPATGGGWSGDTRTYFGPSTVAANTTR